MTTQSSIFGFTLGYHGQPKSDEMTENFVAVEITGEAAIEYADAVGILLDLDFAADAAGQLLALQTKEDGCSIVARSLWRAALISYSRCFASGIREKLHDSVVPAEFMDSHKMFIDDYRSKHIAHPVNQVQHVTCGIRLLPPGKAGSGRIVGTIAFHSEICPAPDRVREFTRLVDQVKKEAEVAALRRKENLLQYARTLGVDALYQLPLRAHAIRPEKEALKKRGPSGK
jgi:hypothetical protein